MTKCEACGEKALRRVYTVPNIGGRGQDFSKDVSLGSDQIRNTDPKVRDAYIGQAVRAGVSVQGKSYQGGLARFPGDPEAYVSNLDEFKAKAKARGLAVPSLGIQGREVAPEDGVTVPEELVQARIGKMVEAGKLKPQDVEKRHDEIADTLLHAKHRGKYKRPKKTKRAK